VPGDNKIPPFRAAAAGNTRNETGIRRDQTQLPNDQTCGLDEETLDILATAHSVTYANAFTPIVDQIKEAVQKAVRELPNQKKAAVIPIPRLLYSSNFSGRPGTTVVLLPEQHIFLGRDPFEVTDGICPYAAKVVNCHLLKALFEHDQLEVQNSFHESSVRFDDDMNSDFETTLEEVRYPAFYYANHLSRSKGNESLPAESLDEELKTIVQRFVFLSMLYTESNLPDNLRAFQGIEMQQMLAWFGFGSMDDLTRSMTVQVNEANRILVKSGNDESVCRHKFNAALKEVEEAISPPGQFH
jgi:hypothetical protein